MMKATLGGSPNPPAMGSAKHSSASPDAMMGTLGGSPTPPAMGSAKHSSASPDAIIGIF